MGTSHAHLLKWGKSCFLPLTYLSFGPRRVPSESIAQIQNVLKNMSLLHQTVDGNYWEKWQTFLLQAFNVESLFSVKSVCTWPFSKKHVALLTSLSWGRTSKSTPLLWLPHCGCSTRDASGHHTGPISSTLGGRLSSHSVCKFSWRWSSPWEKHFKV